MTNSIRSTAELNPNEIFLALSERNSLVHIVNRFQNQTRPNLPPNMQTCVICPPYTNKLSGDAFLRYDSGLTDPNRILVFYTDQGLRSLAANSYLYADGTFDTVPSIFF